MKNSVIACDYCHQPAELVRSHEIYPNHQDFGWFWLCRSCNAWVGTHKGSRRHAPLGRLAKAELRRAKSTAHAAFDRLWEAKMLRDGCSKSKARGVAYKWLSEQMGIPARKMHIGYLDVADCARVVELCESLRTPTR